ncbi:MAG: DUF484 family protein [Nitrosospira sp.]|nr:DUF484 family protein [Nitrosospira sp.]
MKLDAEEVAQYLRQFPEFFEEYADMLAEIQVPDPHGGRAIPINERQIAALRDKNRILQERLGELIRFGEENGAITEKMHRLAVALLTSHHLSGLLYGLKFHLREDFSVPHMALRLWNISAEDSSLQEFAPASADIQIVAESLVHPYCGCHIVDEIREWFREDAARLRSFAMVTLRAERTIGLLVMGSEDPQRFYPEMGTIYLTRLGELVSAALGRPALTDG